MTKREEKKLGRKREESGRLSMVVHPSLGGRIADIAIVLILAIVAFICIIPLWHVFMASISDGYSLLSHKGTVWKPVGEATLGGDRLVCLALALTAGPGTGCCFPTRPSCWAI